MLRRCRWFEESAFANFSLQWSNIMIPACLLSRERPSLTRQPSRRSSSAHIRSSLPCSSAEPSCIGTLVKVWMRWSSQRRRVTRRTWCTFLCCFVHICLLILHPSPSVLNTSRYASPFPRYFPSANFASIVSRSDRRRLCRGGRSWGGRCPGRRRDFAIVNAGSALFSPPLHSIRPFASLLALLSRNP